MPMSNNQTPTDLRHVVLLGDRQTVDHFEMLEGVAAQHGAAISAVFSFEPGEPASQQDLADIQGLVAALGHAIANRLSVWIPYPREDLVREQHFRRVGLVLQRHGLDLIAGVHLMPCPTTGGSSEVDFALRTEVQNVDNLDRAALAAGGVETLEQEIEAALVASVGASAGGRRAAPDQGDEEAFVAMSTNMGFDIMVSLPPSIPVPDAPWELREPALRRHVMWLTYRCGLTQAAAAQCLNLMGHRTPLGRLWKQSTVSGLLKGRYDRSGGTSVR